LILEELYRRLSLDKRNTDDKRYALSTEEIQNLRAGNDDSLIDMKVINRPLLKPSDCCKLIEKQQRRFYEVRYVEGLV
jgi:hypothetical protein